MKPFATATFVSGATCSALAADTNKIPDLKPPLAAIPPSFWETHASAILIGVVIGVAILLLVMWVVFRKKAVPLLPTDVLARQALEALRNRPEDAETVAGVALHLRRYLQAALAFPPGERTTGELITTLRLTHDSGRDACATVPADLVETTARLLEECDARRFAPVPPASASGMVNRAIEITVRIDALRKPERPAA
jgi:hypothetical protein